LIFFPPGLQYLLFHLWKLIVLVVVFGEFKDLAIWGFSFDNKDHSFDDCEYFVVFTV